jgi:hypothetical protein
VPGFRATSHPSPHTRPPPSSFLPPPSFSGYHPCLSLISFFPPSLLIFEPLQLSPSSQICCTTLPLSHPSSLLLLHTLFCTQDQLIYSSHFVFLSFAPLVVVSASGVVFFYKIVLIQVFALLLFVSSNCSTPLFVIDVFLRFFEVAALC